MQWSEFLVKLKEAKIKKKNKGLQVPCITTLIYSGAFDSMIPTEWPKNHETYHRMYTEVLIALKSKANLPAKTKTAPIGLSDVNEQGETALELWRWSTNPLSSFDLVSRCLEPLKSYGFEYYLNGSDPTFKMYRPADQTRKRPASFVSDHWAAIFADRRAFELFNKTAELAVVGIVTETEMRPFGDGKEMLKFRLYTGREYTDEIVVWPTYGGNTVNPVDVQNIKPMRVGTAIIKLTEFNGRPGGSLKKWIPLNR